MRLKLQVPSTLFLILTLVVTASCSKEARTNRAVAKAEKLYESGDYEAAQIMFYNVLRLDPQHPVALRRLALLYAQQGRWSLAAPVLVQAVKMVPEDLELRRWLGTLYLASGRIEDARIQADFILEKQPTNTEAILILTDTARQPREIEELRMRLKRMREQAGDHAAFHLAEANLKRGAGELQGAEIEARLALEQDAQSGIGQIVLGKILADQNRREEAEVAYAEGFAMSPADSIRRIQWPRYLLAQGRAEEAYPLLQEMKEQNPEAIWVSIPLASAALEVGELEECEELITQVFKSEPRNAEALSLEAQLKLTRGNRGEAVAALERLVKDHPNSVQFNYQLALGYIASGNIDGALSTLRHVLELDPQVAPPAFMLADLYLRLRDVQSARAILKGLAKQLPGDRRVQLLTAELFIQEGKLDEAASIYRSLISNNPEDVASSYHLGQVLLLQGRKEEARAMFESVVSQSPDYLPAVNYLADLDLGESDVSSSLARLKAEVERNPQSPATRFLLGQAFVAAGDLDAAEAEYKQVVQLVPDQPHGYLALARLYTSQTNRLQEARQQLESMRSNSSGKAQALLMLALLDASQGDYASARDHYEELLVEQPENLLALNKLAFLYATHLGNPSRALELANTARKKAPRDPMVADTYGWALVQQGDYGGAVQALQEAVSALPGNAVVLHHLGMAYYMRGNEEQARQCLEDALRLGETYKYLGEVQDCLAVLAVEPGNSDEQAVTLLNKMVAKSSKDPVAVKRLAAIHESRGENLQAQQLYERAYQANSNSLPILLGLARAYSLVPDKATNAMQLARAARKMAPQDPAVSYALGKLAFRAGDYRWAVSLLEESQSRRPDNPEISRDLALAYYSVGRLADSQRAIDQAGPEVSSNSESLRRFQTMLALQQKIQNPEDARRQAEEALAAEPASIPARMVLGMAAEQLGDYELAGQSYMAVLGAYPEFFPAMKRMAIVAAEHQGNDKLALELGIRARDVLPADDALAGSLGKVMYRQGDYLHAAQLLQERVRQDPGDLDALYYLGLAQMKVEMVEAGRETLSKALKLDAGNGLAPQAREALK